jgi:PIN domain nuclease of toxin-antitoxin system
MSRRCLLDTHLMLWWVTGDRRLGAPTRRLIETSACAVSVITMAEIAMKAAAGKVQLPAQPLDEQLERAGIAILALSLAHVQAASRLMGHHADPFDCLLVGTALSEKMLFATRDQALLEHAAPLLGRLLVEA